MPVPVFVAAGVAALIASLRTWLPSLIARVLIAFGVGLVVYQAAIPNLIDLIDGYLMDLPDFWIDVFGALWCDIAISMILSVHASVAATRVMLARSLAAG